MRISAARTSTKNGYTLIELAVVICLLGIVTFATVPRIAGFIYTGDLKTAARDMIQTVLRARTDAVTEGKTYYLFIDLSNQNYWLLDFPESQSSDDTSLKRTDIVLGEAVKKHLLPGNIRFLGIKVNQDKVVNEGVKIIRCFPMGFTDPATIYLGSSREKSCTLVLDALTGKVELKDGYVEK